MNELRELYQEVILDHNKKPRHFYSMTDPDRKAEGYNPLCGDHIYVYLKFKDHRISEVSFEGVGCAISKASASMMTSALEGKTTEEAENIFHKFHQMITGKPGETPDPTLGKLAVFSGVCEFPSRVKCASLAWHTMRSALAGSESAVSTEREGAS